MLFDAVARQLRELAVRVLGRVALVVDARVLEAAHQVLALRHHEQRRRARLDLVRLRKLDQRLLVLARIEQLQAHLVVGPGPSGRVVGGARGRGGQRAAREDHRRGARGVTCPGTPLWTRRGAARLDATSAARASGRRGAGFDAAGGAPRPFLLCAGAGAGAGRARGGRRGRRTAARRRSATTGGGAGANDGRRRGGGAAAATPRVPRSATARAAQHTLPAKSSGQRCGPATAPAARRRAGAKPTFWSPASSRSRSRSRSAIVG